MKSAMVSLLCLLPLASVNALDLVGHRVANVYNRCTYACLETAGRAQGIEKMHGFMMRNIGPGYMHALPQNLGKDKINAILEDDGVYNRETLKQYAESHGVTVTMVAGADFIDYRGCHSILVKNYGDEEVEYFDPNHRLDEKKISRKEFDRYWAGNAVVILPGEATNLQVATGRPSKSVQKAQPAHKFEQPDSTGNLVEHPTVKWMLERDTALRAKVGLSPRQLDERLCQAAMQHARYMASGQLTRNWNGYVLAYNGTRFTHYGDGDMSSRVTRYGFPIRSVSENIAMTVSGFDAFDNWRDSSGHYANIVGNTKLAGFGLAYGQSGEAYWVAVYGTPAQPVAAN